MPYYDYKCPSCEKIQEEFHLMSEDPEVKCPACGSIMNKTVSEFSFHMKSGGTRKQTWRQRHGHKKTENQPTPLESSRDKASQVYAKSEHEKKLNKDPYYQHRD